jgi:hypothetical protein
VNGIRVRIEKAHRNRLDARGEQPIDHPLDLGGVEGLLHLAPGVHPFADDEPPRDAPKRRAAIWPYQNRAFRARAVSAQSAPGGVSRGAVEAPLECLSGSTL